MTVSHSFVLPPVAMGGEDIVYEYKNTDIISGHLRYFLTMWRIPASKPKNPKEDEPFERFRLGDFSSANQIILSDDETLYLFHKRGEDKENYLRFKNYRKPTQKKLASLQLRPEHAQEILDISHASPQKVKEVLAKYEKKYKPKKFWG